MVRRRRRCCGYFTLQEGGKREKKREESQRDSRPHWCHTRPKDDFRGFPRKTTLKFSKSGLFLWSQAPFYLLFSPPPLSSSLVFTGAQDRREKSPFFLRAIHKSNSLPRPRARSNTHRNMSGDPNEVAKAFTQHYYSTWTQSPDGLAGLYVRHN